MTAQELKNSILQLAIQGKLVEQRPEEGTAEELYRQIQSEKAKLLKAGKIKKEKPLPDITEDEIPFEIPETWKWVRLSSIGITQTGNTPSKKYPEYIGKDIPFITPGDILNGLIDYKNQALSSLGKEVARVSPPGTILQVCIGGSIGKAAITNQEVTYNQQINAITPIICESCYAYFVMTSPYFTIHIKNNAGGTATPIINKGLWDNLLFPLPPLAEQKRIVAKIEEIFPYIERFGVLRSQLRSISEDLRKSILQQAIQGKLVEQRPEEGTAEELYRQIQSEKAKLLKVGKIKKEKPPPEITEDEIPFEIPETWKWVRIGQIFNLQAGKNISASAIYENVSTEHQFLCYGGNGIRGYVSNYNRNGHYALIGRQGALCGNINFAKGQFYATEHAVVVDHYNLSDVLWSGYFLQALNLNQYATATAQPGLAVSNIIKVLIPLPPLAEQKRIVKKIEDLLKLCDQLNKKENIY